jgi:hypothetical protein
VSQQLHDGTPVSHSGGHGLSACVALAQPLATVPDEVPHMAMSANFPFPRIVDHHLTRPGHLKSTAVAVVQRGDVFADRVDARRGAGLPARHL